LETETEIVEYQDGDDIILRKRPGRTKYANLVLKRGYINNDELWQWRKKVIDGLVERKSGSVILCADDGTEIMRYNFFEGWPSKWKGFTLDGKGTDVNVEEIELAVEKVEKG
jgi:phage tail-like protein